MALPPPLRRLVQRGYEVTGLIGPLHRRAEQRIARQPAPRIEDGLPMPADDLRVTVSGTSDQVWFSEQGRTHAEWFQSVAARHGLSIANGLAVWDLGCGCGRIARWMASAVTKAGGVFYGSDINRDLVAWCLANLPGRYFVNRLTPPVDIEERSLDLVYAYSVVTHLRERAARAWLAELARTLRPGGLALVSFHDETYASAFGPAPLQSRLDQHDYVVLNNALEGSNYMSTWTTRSYFRELAEPHFEVLEIQPARTEPATQALAVLRARQLGKAFP